MYSSARESACTLITPQSWSGRWASQAALAWAVGYGLLRVYWALGTAPSLPPAHTDLIVFTGWWAVALCAAAAAVVVVAGLRTARWRRPLAVAAWAVTAALAAASALVLLDLVGLLLPGVGAGVHPAAFASRAACLAGNVLVSATTLCYQRHWGGACLACGRTGEAARPARPPRWAWAAAWTAVAGCLARLLAQVAPGLGELLRAGGPGLGFEAGFLLAGIVLPLALVYRWGGCSRDGCRCWPAGACRGGWCWARLGLGAGMTVYFGLTMVKLAAGTLTGAWAQDFGSYPLWFFWVVVPAYLAWGLGLGIAALAYRARPVLRAGPAAVGAPAAAAR